MRKIKRKNRELPARDKQVYAALLLGLPATAIVVPFLIHGILSDLAFLDPSVAALCFPQFWLLLIGVFLWTPAELWLAYQFDKKQPFFPNAKMNYQFFKQEPFFSKAYWVKAGEKPLKYILMAACILISIVCGIVCFNNRVCLKDDCEVNRLNLFGQVTEQYTPNQITGAKLYAGYDFRHGGTIGLSLQFEDESYAAFYNRDFRDYSCFELMEQMKKIVKNMEIQCNPKIAEKVEWYFEMDPQTKQQFRALFELE